MPVLGFVICCCMVISAIERISCTYDNKRLVLHNDVDMAAAIQMLTSRLEAMSAVVEQLTAQNNQLEADVQTLKTTSSGVSVYTRWGRTTCTQNGSELIYAGYTGGNLYTKNGAADYICLSGDPLWGVYDDSAQTYTLKIYGTDYEFSASFSDGGARFFLQKSPRPRDPCAVCRSSRATTVMIPDRNQCYPGWTMEYWG
ncbi:hypothetical protein DPMN_135929 [Dreissena polymorpha]|uniref:Uncharacterized protein n=1 Tax=Dreissena polymorpha TaxID=45954 RepID=A0A9D4G1U0_DREPO|nr:hypothetical protein DPMN_135929 [Dreissena polymorpha]